MFYDLHVLWQGHVAETQQTLQFLSELGYNTVGLTHVLAGKLPGDLTCAIPQPLPLDVPPNLRVLRRCDLILSDPSQNHRLTQLAANYDILALRPTNEKSLLQACHSLDCDIISIDLTARLEAHLKMKALAQAIERGIKFEIGYAPGLAAGDSIARRNLISNATQLIRATRGRGLILSSEAHRAISCRAPADVINLAAVWGLGPEKGKDALDKLARSVVVRAQLTRTGYRGAVDIISPSPVLNTPDGPVAAKSAKRKTVDLEDSTPDEPSDQPPPSATTPQPSKRALKRRKKAQLASNDEAAAAATATTANGIESSKPS